MDAGGRDLVLLNALTEISPGERLPELPGRSPHTHAPAWPQFEGDVPRLPTTAATPCTRCASRARPWGFGGHRCDRRAPLGAHFGDAGASRSRPGWPPVRCSGSASPPWPPDGFRLVERAVLAVVADGRAPGLRPDPDLVDPAGQCLLMRSCATPPGGAAQRLRLRRGLVAGCCTGIDGDQRGSVPSGPGPGRPTHQFRRRRRPWCVRLR